MNREELELFRESMRQATAARSGPALDDALDELGWTDALVADRRSAVSSLFELQGESNATSSALDAVVSSALGLTPDLSAQVVLPPFGCCHPPGALRAERLDVRGIGSAGLRCRDRAVVVAELGDEQVIVSVDTADLELRSVSGIDATIAIVEAAGDRIGVSRLSDAASTMWPDAVAAGQLALAHELVGSSKAMLQLARDHAVERVQFGRTIATFQAVRHRLAESLVAIEAAEAALAAAWDVGSPLGAALGKATAGRNARTVARHCQQVLAGIGFTREHPFHRHVRRALVLDGILGDARSLTRDLGEELLRTRRLPSVLPL